MKHYAADALLMLHSNSEETTNLDFDLLVCNVQNIRVTKEERSYVHVCTKGEVAYYMIAGLPDAGSMKMGKTKLGAVQPTERPTRLAEISIFN